MAENTALVSESVTVEEVRRTLVCAVGQFFNPESGIPSLKMPLSVRKKVGDDPARDIATGKVLSIALTDPNLLIPYVDETFSPVSIYDADGNLIPGTYFPAWQVKAQLFSVFRYLIDQSIADGTLLNDINPKVLPDLTKVLAAMGGQL